MHTLAITKIFGNPFRAGPVSNIPMKIPAQVPFDDKCVENEYLKRALDLKPSEEMCPVTLVSSGSFKTNLNALYLMVCHTADENVLYGLMPFKGIIELSDVKNVSCFIHDILVSISFTDIHPNIDGFHWWTSTQ
jgi:hypothetical protein